MGERTTAPGSDVRACGAAGDGRRLDTAAFQKAVDACHAAGGGRVLVPAGEYLVGSIELRSNVELHLASGARLLASTAQRDYRPLPLGAPASPASYGEEHLIFARGAENVAITGTGTVDGRGREFFGPIPADSFHHSLKGWRPVQLVAFVECRNVLISGVTFRDAPGWTVWPLGCERVRISGVSILNNRWGPNTDGIDPDCCRDVVISDCILDCGDDCIAVKSSIDKLGRRTVACEGLAVSNCVMSTSCCAIRLGYEGDGPIRGCTFSNLVMRRTRTGINMLVPRHREAGIEHGPAIENIAFSNLVMDTHVPFFLWVADDAARPGGIRGVSFSGVTATTGRGCHLGGRRGHPIESIRMSDVELTVNGPMDGEFWPNVPYPYRVWDYLTKAGPNRKRGIPHALYFRHARDVALRDVRVRWGDVSGAWRSALRGEHLEGLDVDGLVACGAPGPAGAPAVHLSATRRACFRGCRAERGAGPFLLADAGCEELSALGNDLAAAGRSFDVPEGALRESGNLPAPGPDRPEAPPARRSSAEGRR